MDLGAGFAEEPWGLAGLRRRSGPGGRFGRRTGRIVVARCLATEDGTAGDADHGWMRPFVLFILILRLVLSRPSVGCHSVTCNGLAQDEVFGGWEREKSC